MNSTVIKVVAGGGKTTESEKIMKREMNGLYLAFNNEVVNEMRLKGYVSKTIDSLFFSFVIPKFTSIIPIIGKGARVEYVDTMKLLPNLKGVGNIHINENGDILNGDRKTDFSLNTSNEELHNLRNKTNLLFIKYIFGKNELRLTHKLRSELIYYIISNYPYEVIDILDSRFSFIIFDETQDTKSHLEEFAKLIYNSKIKSYFLGDSNQNINGGGNWFEKLTPNKTFNRSFRCPENNCKWIRENLDIEIFGNTNDAQFKKIPVKDIQKYDDGERILLYYAKKGIVKDIVEQWSGKKYTIKEAKGKTLIYDVVIIGTSLNKKAYYTAITRTTKNVFSAITKIS